MRANRQALAPYPVALGQFATDLPLKPGSTVGAVDPQQRDLLEQLGDRDTLFAVLALLLPWGQARAAAEHLLNRFGSFAEVLAAPEEQLLGAAEIGIGVVSALKVLHGAALRLVAAPLKQGPILNNWAALEAYLMAAMARELVEQFRVLFLDSRNRLIADEVLAIGGPRGVNPDHRALARQAVRHHATAVILTHNHPSGDPHPSVEDVDVTRALQQTLDAVGVILHDHLIVARSGLQSLRRLGLLKT